jgi:hypothetical protein
VPPEDVIPDELLLDEVLPDAVPLGSSSAPLLLEAPELLLPPVVGAWEAPDDVGAGIGLRRS